MTYQDKLDKFTFLIPIFNLKDERLDNFKFILPKIKEITDNILVVEQVKNKKDRSEAYNFTKSLGIEYLPVKVNDDHIHKSKIINVGTDKIKTEFVWVNDSDCYLKFKKVIELLDLRHNFIQPYNIAKYIEKEDTNKIINNEPVNIEFNYSRLHETGQYVVPGTLYYVAMYGALSFIYRKYAFKKIGGMNEKYTGWGLEDNSLCMRMFMSELTFDIINQAGIHLYHPRGKYKEKLECNRTLNNIKVYEEEFGGGYTDLHEKLREYYNEFFQNTTAIFGIARSGTTVLITTLAKIFRATPYNEPFNIDSVRNIESDTELIKYVDRFTKCGNSILKHQVNEKSGSSRFNLTAEGYSTYIIENIVSKYNRIIITTRANFLDWVTSFHQALKTSNWCGSEYNSKLKMSEQEFNIYYKIWSEYHFIDTPYIQELCTRLEKKYIIIDYDDLQSGNGTLEGIGIDLSYNQILNETRIKKQKKGNNSEYIVNYNEVLNWFNSAKKSL